MQTKKEYLASLISLASAFIFAYCLQITVHEMGHALAGWMSGATGAKIHLHPFLNSLVTFKYVPSTQSQVFIGVMGSITDLVFATIFAWIAWRKSGFFSLPLVLWGAVAYIGEGIGMLGNIAALPYSYDDIGQLMHLGISPKPLIPLCILFIFLGLILLVAAMPLSGVSLKAPFIKRFAAYFCSLPLYFSMAILYFLVFDTQNVNDLELRVQQFAISLFFSLLLAVFNRPLDSLINKVIKTKSPIQPTSAKLITLVSSSLSFFALLIGYAAIFN